MVVQTNSFKFWQPKRKKRSASQKPSELFRELLTSAIPKVKRPNPQSPTIDKCINVLLTQMLIDGSDIEASSFLQSLISIIQEVLEMIKAQTNPLETLTTLIAKLKAPTRDNIVTISGPTLAAYVDTIPLKTADLALDRQLDAIEANLKKQGVSPKEIALCIDPTDKIYRGKYHNRWTNWGVTGQVATYKRAYKECSIYSNPTGLFVSSTPVPINPSSLSDRASPHWLKQMQEAIYKNQSHGVTTKLLIGDKEYSRGIGMAYAYFGMFTPLLPITQAPRLLTPLRDYDTEADGKWIFLLNDHVPQVEETSMQLGYYHAKFLGDRCHSLALTKKRDHFLIPIAKVAAFDSYSHTTTRRSFEWAHIKAQSIAVALTQAELRKIDAEMRYMAYCNTRGDKTCKPPKYSKKGRRVFKDPSEKPLYAECRACHHRVVYWQKQKEHLMRRLIFYGVSLHQGESLEAIQTELIALVEHYHERWGIEICFKGMKGVFHLQTNVRGTKARHVRKIMSGMVYNCWHATRLKRWSRRKKQENPGWKPYDIQSPPMKKKYRGDLGQYGTAHSFLLENWADQIISSLKKVIISRI